jgi:hypothetical protein
MADDYLDLLAILPIQAQFPTCAAQQAGRALDNGVKQGRQVQL